MSPAIIGDQHERSDVYRGANTTAESLNRSWIKKRYPGPMNAAQIEELTQAYGIWIPELTRLGVTFPAMRWAFRPVGRSAYELTLYEEPFDKHELCRDMLEQAAPEVVCGISRRLIGLVMGIATSERGIGIDLKFSNFAQRGKNLVLIDTFPPLTDRAHTRFLWTQQMRNPFYAAGLLTVPGLLDSFIAEFYQPEFMLLKLYRRFCVKRPELAGQFVASAQAAIDTCNPPRAEAMRAVFEERLDYPPVRRALNALKSLQP